jgi:hypothetical protein
MHGSLDEGRVQQDRETIASELLNILHSIPIQSIATNGPSLVHKVRFVASTLLDAVRKAETAPATAARAHAYLCKHHLSLTSIQPLTLSQGTSCLSCRRSSATTCSMTVVMPLQARMAWVVLLKDIYSTRVPGFFPPRLLIMSYTTPQDDIATPLSHFLLSLHHLLYVISKCLYQQSVSFLHTLVQNVLVHLPMSPYLRL